MTTEESQWLEEYERTKSNRGRKTQASSVDDSSSKAHGGPEPLSAQFEPEILPPPEPDNPGMGTGQAPPNSEGGQNHQANSTSQPGQGAQGATSPSLNPEVLAVGSVIGKGLEKFAGQTVAIAKRAGKDTFDLTEICQPVGMCAALALDKYGLLKVSDLPEVGAIGGLAIIFGQRAMVNSQINAEKRKKQADAQAKAEQVASPSPASSPAPSRTDNLDEPAPIESDKSAQGEGEVVKLNIPDMPEHEADAPAPIA